MKRTALVVSLALSLALLTAHGLCADPMRVTLPNGKTALLFDNGTWKEEEQAAVTSWREAVMLSGFGAALRDYDGLRSDGPMVRHIPFGFMWMNLSSKKTINAIEFKMKFGDKFGDVVYEEPQLAKDGVTLKPLQVDWGMGWNYRASYYDNMDVNYPVFNTLKAPVMSRTLTASVSVRRIVYSDGTVVTFPDNEWSKVVPMVTE